MNTACQMPSKERLQKGPVVFIECPERIACNPCQEVCAVGAINMSDVNSLPEIDFEKCKGCGLCVQICPGLAIFMAQYSGDKILMTLPYEYLPIPQERDVVRVLNKNGKGHWERESY